MRLIVSYIIYLMIIPLAFFTVYSVRKKENVSKSLIIMNSLCLLTMYLYATSLWASSYNIVFGFANFYYASITWLLFSVVNFVFIFSGIKKSRTIHKVIKFLLFIMCICDLWGFFVNFFTGYTVSIEQTFSKHTLTGWIAHYKTLFKIHLAISYIQVAIIAIVLLSKVITSAKIFRRKYVIVLSLFLLIIILDGIFLTMIPDFDFGLFFYMALAIYLSYVSLFSMPKFFSSQMMNLISQNLNHAVICFDAYGNKIYSNRIADEFIKQEDNYNHILYLIEKTDEDFFMDSEIFTVKGEDHFFDEEVSHIRDNKNKLVGICVKLSDNTKVVKQIQSETFNSSHDMLTGFYNRSSFFKNAGEIIRRNRDQEFYIIATNIKDFKIVNTLFGTDLGDEVLMKQAQLLRHAAYNNCIHGRISADHFAMLISKENFNQELAVKNTSLLQELFSDLHYKLGLYIGVYEVSDIYEDVSSMYDKAQLAIKSIYGSYNQSLAFYSKDIMEQLYEEKNIVSDFDNILNSNQFKLYLSPHVNCETGFVCGAQGVVRWEKPMQGVIYENDFVSLLERTMLVHRYDSYIWEKAVEILSDWQKKENDMYITVKVNQQDFYYMDVPKVLKSLVEKYNVNPSRLVLEINENCFTHDVKLLIDTINKLHEEGFKIELDEFGAEFSSLNILKDINADMLKINFDHFYQNSQNQRTLTIIESMIVMIKSIGMTVAARCVEFDSQKDFLRKCGCDIIQESLYKKTVDKIEFERLYADGGL